MSRPAPRSPSLRAIEAMGAVRVTGHRPKYLPFSHKRAQGENQPPQNPAQPTPTSTPQEYHTTEKQTGEKGTDKNPLHREGNQDNTAKALHKGGAHNTARAQHRGEKAIGNHAKREHRGVGGRISHQWPSRGGKWRRGVVALPPQWGHHDALACVSVAGMSLGTHAAA
jgi:hypothetical protein